MERDYKLDGAKDQQVWVSSVILFKKCRKQDETPP